MNDRVMLKKLVDNAFKKACKGELLEEYGKKTIDLVKEREKEILEYLMDSDKIKDIWSETYFKINHAVEMETLRESHNILTEVNSKKLNLLTLAKLKADSVANPIEGDFTCSYVESTYENALSEMMKGNTIVCVLDGINYRWRYNPNPYFVQSYGTPEVTEDHIRNGKWYVEHFEINL